MSDRPMKTEFVKKCDHICMMEEGHHGIHQYGYEHPSPRERDRDYFDAREELDKLRAAPVEPPVLSREFLDSLIQAHHAENRSNFRDAYYNWLRGAESLRDAILESLSQEDG